MNGCVQAALTRQLPKKADSLLGGRHGLASAMWRRSDPHARPSFSYLVPTQSCSSGSLTTVSAQA